MLETDHYKFVGGGKWGNGVNEIVLFCITKKSI